MPGGISQRGGGAGVPVKLVLVEMVAVNLEDSAVMEML